jgi:hypothetical protein
MRRKFAIGRTVGLLLGVFALGNAAVFYRSFLQAKANFESWQTARPTELQVDLSKLGKTTMPFHQTCSCSHGEGIFLKLKATGQESNGAPAKSLEDLSAVLVISDAKGDEVQSVELAPPDSNDGSDPMLARFHPFATGEYRATLRVSCGAKALAGTEQTLYAKYLLCGLEMVPGEIARLIACGLGLIGIIAVACSLPGLLRHGFWRPQQHQSQDCVPQMGPRIEEEVSE